MSYIVGAELEAAFSLDRFRNMAGLNSAIAREGFKTHPMDQHRYDYDAWQTTYEGLDFDASRWFGCELISPALPIAQYISEMENMIAFLGDDVHTNVSTGFHHGISFVDKSKNDLLSMRRVYLWWLWASKYEAIEGAKWQGRNDGPYTKSHASFYNNYTSRHYPQQHMRVSQFLNWPYIIGSGKCMTVNFGKLTLTQGSYVELRIMGGTDYHRRFQDVLQSVNTFIGLMEETVSNKLDMDNFEKFMNRGISNLSKSDYARALQYA